MNEQPLIKLHETHLELMIYPNGNGYPIEYDRMDSPEKILGWVYHLTKKVNVTKPHLRAFIESAKQRGMSIIEQ